MLAKILAAGAMLAAAAFAPAMAEGGSLNDLQIAHIAYTAGLIDIGYADIALQKSKNADVRAFADTMERDHKAVNDAALALLAKLKVSPEDNPTSKTLNKQAADERAKLSALSGAAFDKAYADNELAYHQFVNKTLEETLIPETQNEELKDLLTSALATFREHQQHAAHLVAKLK